MKNSIKRYTLILLGLFTVITSCEDDPIAIEVPTPEDAIFTFEVDAENPNKIHFKGQPQKESWFTHWDFGDNSSAEGLEVTKVFLKKGDYDVRFKVFTEAGSAESIQTVLINEDFQGPNILKNGDFTSADSWSILPIADGVEVSFENEAAHWSGDGWGHAGIYQAVNVLGNNLYQISMDITGGPLSDSWFEVYVGKEIPQPGSDYTDGGIRIGLNTWNGCGNEPFDGDFSEFSCAGEGPTFKFSETGTVYLVIRGGGADYGENGVTVDNVAIRSLESSEVLPAPLIANFGFETNDLTVKFSNASTNATTYSWDFGDGTATSSEENPEHTYASGGIYTVKLTASNNSESNEIVKQVTVIDPSAAPEASFTSSVNYLEVAFTNTSANATTYEWDFGDGIGTSELESPTYTYSEPGTHTVTLVASKDGESNTFTAEVITIADPNLISNGNLNDGTGWTVVNHYEAANTNGMVTFENGVAKFTETTNTDWKHMGIYTAVTLEAGTYQFNMDMTYTGINDLWGEVYIGSTEPIQHQDYTGDIYVLKAYNSWDCGAIKTYSGNAASSGCDPADTPGRFEITIPGTYYLLFRTGGQTYGTDGIVIDNVSLIKL